MASGILQLLANALVQGLHAPGILDEDLPFRGWIQAFFTLSEDLNSIFLLQLLDLVADGGLGQVQGVGRLGIAAHAQKGEQGAQFVVQHGVPFQAHSAPYSCN